MRKKAILLALLGYVIGCLIGLGFSLSSEDFSLGKALPRILLGGIPGAVAMGSAVIYDVERWSLLRATTTHFVIVMGVICFGCFVLDWFEPWSTAFWIMMAAEVVAYFIIWLIMYKGYRGQIRKLNEMLKNSTEEPPSGE